MNIVKYKKNSKGNPPDEYDEMTPVKTILILAANPKKTSRLRLDEEVREIEKALRRSKYRNLFKIHSVWAVGHRDIRQALLEYEPTFVHFIGHGRENCLMVENEFGTAVRFSTKAFSELFKLCADHIECIILNACYTEPLSNAITKHIDYVIGMKMAIKDKASIEFAAGFYDALGAGRTVDDAFAFGRTAIMAQFPDLPDYLIPSLKKKTGLINLQFCMESTGDIYYIRTSSDSIISALKSRIINELELPINFENGKQIPYFLFSKTQDKIMEENKTLFENDVKENETFVFLIEVDETASS